MRDQIEKHLRRGELQAALDTLINYVKVSLKFQDIYQELVLIEPDINTVIIDELNGLSTSESIRSRKRELIKALIAFMNKIFPPELNQIIELQVAQIPFDQKAIKVCSKDKVEELAHKIGLFEERKVNPDRKFDVGDISHFYEQKLPRWQLEIELRARAIELDIAERENKKLETSGDLGFFAESHAKKMTLLWKNKRDEET